jgi:hypothetical protein
MSVSPVEIHCQLEEVVAVCVIPWKQVQMWCIAFNSGRTDGVDR